MHAVKLLPRSLGTTSGFTPSSAMASTGSDWQRRSAQPERRCRSAVPARSSAWLKAGRLNAPVSVKGLLLLLAPQASGHAAQVSTPVQATWCATALWRALQSYCRAAEGNVANIEAKGTAEGFTVLCKSGGQMLAQHASPGRQ
jgi:hypothetical protein